MKSLSALIVPLLAVVLSACSTTASGPHSAGSSSELRPVADAKNLPHETILLVSLEDGSVIRQTINTDAEFCFKNNYESSTICLSRGDAIVDADNQIIGFEMIEDRIDLVAKSN